jgi:large subunit ribosomal protein L24
LSKELREKYSKRRARPRVGDSVRIVRGGFKDIEGKITAVLPKEGAVNVEGVNKERQKGGNAPIPIQASKIVITSVNLDDATRKKKLEATT